MQEALEFLRTEENWMAVIRHIAATMPYQCQRCTKRAGCPEVWDNVDGACWHQENAEGKVSG